MRYRLTRDDGYRHFLNLCISHLGIHARFCFADILAGHQHRRAIIIVVHCEVVFGTWYVVEMINRWSWQLLRFAKVVLFLASALVALFEVQIWCLNLLTFNVVSISKNSLSLKAGTYTTATKAGASITSSFGLT